ncbi:MAG: 3-deoxy-manno-octulosonate cytidylyltransferase [Arenimonas sp.]|nr:3-deoxy-manno-octulosonate cytidylyltransferase [Arenimonas sp.]
MTAFIVAIPARYASTRLPGKPLCMIGDQPMIVHVAKRALAAGAKQVVIATDDQRIVDAVHMDGVLVCLTSPDHQSGTDRLAECAKILQWPDDEIIVNLQGDEPFAPADGIRQVATVLAKSSSDMATLACAIQSNEQYHNPNIVKVVRSLKGRALYFSRAPIPNNRDNPESGYEKSCRHIGIYAYRARFLKQFSELPISSLERCESLEQLRVLENGFSIAVELAVSEFQSGVDTYDDLQHANRYWQKSHVHSNAD